MSTAAIETAGCATPGCTQSLTQRLSCPKCIKLGLPPSYFCSQQCFTSNYKQHNILHKTFIKLKQAQELQAQQQAQASNDGVTCMQTESKNIKLSLPYWGYDYNFTGLLRPALQSPKRPITKPIINKPDYATEPSGVSYSEQYDKANNTSIRVYTKDEIENDGLRHACQMGREVLDAAGKAVKVGVTTDEIDRVVHDACMEREVYPSPLNYYQFPKSVCTSVNEVICHGIPDYRELEDGDIVNIDVTTYNKRGFHGDLNETFFVGNVDNDGRKLVETSYNCLQEASKLIKPGTLYRDLGTIIQKTAHANSCSVVRTYCGHGIGSLFHTAPNVPHYHKNKAKGIMKPGHVFTIEPMINLGSPHDATWGDNWTAVTRDGKRSSQFEHTFLVTNDGYEILTARDNEPVMIWNQDLVQR